MTKEEQKKHDIALEYFKALGYWEPGMVLHHVDPTMKLRDPQRYKNWNIDDVEPLTVQQHMRIHMGKKNPKGVKKSADHVKSMTEGHKKERRSCNILISHVVNENGIEGIEAYVFPSCAAAARHIGCTLQLVYQTASKTQHNRTAMGWNCNYVPKTVALGQVAEDMVRSLVA
nr:MAG TPA: hypothetical protein [Caudoviricetes sp.]